ncbi:MAG: lysophospholipase [Granulosicoccus sp.]
MTKAIYTHRWQPPEDVSVQTHGIYLLHGTGEHAARYDAFANRLTAQGFRVGAHDHPGHGRSKGKRGLIDPPGSLATQAALQIQKFAWETDSQPILFGHSLGGSLATELVLQHHLPVAGLILSAPALMPIMRASDKVKLKLLSIVAPTLCLDLGSDPSRLTHDASVMAKASSDALNHSYKSATLVNWLISSGRQSLERAEQINVKTLLLIAGADPIIDSAQTQAFARRIDSDLLTVHEYEGYFHELLNETPERRERVMLDIDHWLESFKLAKD